MTLKNTIATFSLIAALGLIAYPLYAHCGKCAADGKKIAAALDQHKTTLAKAVTAAETHSKGRAIGVISSLNDKGVLGVHVFCMAGEPAKIMKCSFDSATGAITTMKEVNEFPVVADTHAHAGGSVMMITNQTVDAGCGVCIYKMPGVTGCPLAIKIDGKPYLVQGAKWPNHDYCDRSDCKAVVTGKVEGDKFIATSLVAKK